MTPATGMRTRSGESTCACLRSIGHSPTPPGARPSRRRLSHEVRTCEEALYARGRDRELRSARPVWPGTFAAAYIREALRSPPRLSGGAPILGHSLEFLRSAIDLLFRAERELGEIAAFDVFGRRMVAVFGPDAHEFVLRAPDTELSQAEAYKMMTPVFGKDVVYDAPPDRMAEQFRMLVPALQNKRMRTYRDGIVRETVNSVSGWGETGMIDLVAYCRELTSFTSTRSLLGPEFRDELTAEFARVYHDLERGVTPLAYINAHLPLPAFVRRDRARRRMVEMITRIVDRRRREHREGEDFLQTLMEAHYSDGSALTEHEITGLLLAGIFAAHDTSAVTTAWTIVEILRHPEVHARVVGEIDRGVSQGGMVTQDTLRELAFTETVIKETLRLHPPLFMLVRAARTDVVFKGYLISKGSWIIVSPTVAHRAPELFADPDRFDPGRFAAPRKEDERDFAFIAFGGGRHRCMGSAFAMLQIKSILASLLREYELELADDPIVSDFRGLVVSPAAPCRVRYRRRVVTA